MSPKNTKVQRYKFGKEEQRLGYLFILPFTIGFFIFHALPVFVSIVVSTTNMEFLSNLSNLKFIGLRNFVRLFQDTDVMQALFRSFTYTILYVPTIIILGLFLALLINGQIYAKGFIRTAFFMPYVSNFVAIAIVWSVVLDYKDGIINQTLRSFGVSNPPLWLMGEKTVIPTIVFIVTWQGVGLFMIVYLAALQNVPKELYEAANIDGANFREKFIHITLPMISPTTFFCIVTAIITSFQNFGPIQVLTKGGPGQASTTLGINIYLETFSNYRMGYATAQAIVLFVIILIFTIIQWNSQKRWVNYASSL